MFVLGEHFKDGLIVPIYQIKKLRPLEVRKHVHRNEKLSSIKIGYWLNTYYESGAVLNPSQTLFDFKVILITTEIHARYLKSNTYEQNEKINPL